MSRGRERAGPRNGPALRRVRRGSAGDGRLERGRGLEARHRGRGDLDRLAGLGVAALARVALPRLEGAETGDLDLLARGDLGGDGVDDGGQSALGVGLAEARRVGDGLDELVLLHRVLLAGWNRCVGTVVPDDAGLMLL